MINEARQARVFESTTRPGAAGRSVTRSPSVTIQPAACKPPFFCIPGDPGDAPADVSYLARFLRPDQPFYRLGDGLPGYTRIEARAAGYVDEMRAVQPRGPYILGGVCSGGVVAFEVAQQLRAQGQRVALLAMVDPPPPPEPGLRSYLNYAAAIFGQVVQSLRHYSRGISRHDPGGPGEYLDQGTEVDASTSDADEWTVAWYAPRPYPGRIDLFLTSESLTSPNNPQLNWRELATGSAEVHVIPDNHDGTTGDDAAGVEQACVQILTEQLEACIDEALANGYRF